MGRSNSNKGARGKRNNWKKQQKTKSQAQQESLLASEKARVDSDKAKIVTYLAGQDYLSPEKQFTSAKNFAKAFGIPFLGHKSHGGNDTTPRSGVEVMQNVLDGVNRNSPKRTEITRYAATHGVQLA